VVLLDGSKRCKIAVLMDENTQHGLLNGGRVDLEYTVVFLDGNLARANCKTDGWMGPHSKDCEQWSPWTCWRGV
jgi:hypothetical protein